MCLKMARGLGHPFFLKCTAVRVFLSWCESWCCHFPSCVTSGRSPLEASVSSSVKWESYYPLPSLDPHPKQSCLAHGFLGKAGEVVCRKHRKAACGWPYT